MAYEMKIRGTEHEVKVRNPWAEAPPAQADEMPPRL